MALRAWQARWRRRRRLGLCGLLLLLGQVHKVGFVPATAVNFLLLGGLLLGLGLGGGRGRLGLLLVGCCCLRKKFCCYNREVFLFFFTTSSRLVVLVVVLLLSSSDESRRLVDRRGDFRSSSSSLETGCTCRVCNGMAAPKAF